MLFRSQDRNILAVFLAKHNMKIYDYTCLSNELCDRNQEICRWLEQNTVEKYAIIDDDSRAGNNNCFFKTNENVGLTKELTAKIIEHLNSR